MIGVLAGLELFSVKRLYYKCPNSIDFMKNGLLHVLEIAYQKGNLEVFQFLYKQSSVKLEKLFRWSCEKYLGPGQIEIWQFWTSKGHAIPRQVLEFPLIQYKTRGLCY
jgi:hypothetical protein